MTKAVKITYGELSSRFGMSDEVCNLLCVNPYYLAEGGDRTKIARYVTQDTAKQIGILDHEFDERCVEVEDNIFGLI